MHGSASRTRLTPCYPPTSYGPHAEPRSTPTPGPAMPPGISQARSLQPEARRSPSPASSTARDRRPPREGVLRGKQNPRGWRAADPRAVKGPRLASARPPPDVTPGGPTHTCRPRPWRWPSGHRTGPHGAARRPPGHGPPPTASRVLCSAGRAAENAAKEIVGRRKRRFLCLSKKISGASRSKPCCARADRAHVRAAGGPAGRAAVELGRRLGGRQAPHPTQRESRRGNKEGTRRTSQFPRFEALANEAFFPLT